MSTKQAAVAYVEREDGRILVVWNKRYGGWAMPGGLVEEGETPVAAMIRELREETSVESLACVTMWVSPPLEQLLPGRGQIVRLFHVTGYQGTPQEDGAWVSGDVVHTRGISEVVSICRDLKTVF